MGETVLKISSLGYEPIEIDYKHIKNNRLNFELKPAWLEPVLIRYFSDSIVIKQSPNIYDLNIKQATRMASLGGESDLVRAGFSLPGIQTGADGFGGLSVRGGDIDQNLFLLDGVPVYNAMHGIGLFSIYNSSAIRSAKILKGAFPARYGGRMSSVWDVQTKEGSKKEILGEIDIGVTSAKMTLEVPLIKDKASFFFSGRRALFDFYSEPISSILRDNGGLVSFHFQDLNMKLNFDLFNNDRLYISYYAGSDDYDDQRILEYEIGDSTSSVKDSELVNWGNDILALRWNHEYSDKLFSNTTITFSSYQYRSKDLLDLRLFTPSSIIKRDILLQLYASEIKDFAMKFDFDYNSEDVHLKFGGQFTSHRFNAKIATFEEVASIDFIDRDTVGDFSSLPLYTDEYDFYIEDEIEISKKFHANLGCRISSSHVMDKWLIEPQPRLLFTYQENEGLMYDFSVTRMSQFLHRISPSRLGLPKDLWVTSTEKVPPQNSWQFSGGVNKKLKQGFSIDFDIFYKRLYNQLFFKGSIGGVNTYNWQEKVSIGQGKSYGAEFLLQKQGKEWSGWLSYTVSKSNRRFPIEDNINEGKSFPIKLDRRHNLNIQCLYKLNEKWDFGAGFILASGSYYNLPAQEYKIQQPPGDVPSKVILVPIAEGINDQKLRIYNRLDLSANYYFKSGPFDQSLKMGISNAYSHLNPLFRTIREDFDENGVLSTNFYDVSLLPIFPSVRYAVKLK